jgi:hypothetical protein
MECNQNSGWTCWLLCLLFPLVTLAHLDTDISHASGACAYQYQSGGGVTASMTMQHNGGRGGAYTSPYQCKREKEDGKKKSKKIKTSCCCGLFSQSGGLFSYPEGVMVSLSFILLYSFTLSFVCCLHACLLMLHRMGWAGPWLGFDDGDSDGFPILLVGGVTGISGVITFVVLHCCYLFAFSFLVVRFSSV